MADDFNPLNLSEADYARFVERAAAQAPEKITASGPAAGLAPETLNALSEASRSLGQLRTDLSEDTKRLGAREGVFLDTSKGAPASVRTRLGLDENQLNQMKLLMRLYGDANVDLSDEGRFILRNQPARGGGVEDLLVDPVGFESGDVAQMASQALPMVAGAVGAKLGLKGVTRLGVTSPVGKVAAGVTGMALGQEAAGAAQDMAVRLLRGDQVNVPEIARERTRAAAADEVLGLAFAGGTKALTKTAEGLLGLAQVPVGNTATRQAAKELRGMTGVNFPLTPGQETESRLLLRMEAMTGERIGSAAALDRIRAGQQAAEDELRRVFLGLPRTMSDDELKAALPQAEVTGQKGLSRLGSEALRLEGDVANARTAVNQLGTAEAQLKSGVTLATPLNPTEVGAGMRARAVGDFDAFKSAMSERYSEFLSRPEIRTRSISGSQLANTVSRLEQDLIPQAERENVSKAFKVVEPIDAFVPAKVRSALDALTNLKGARVSVNDLKIIRTSLDNAVAEGIAIPGTDVTQLKTIRGAVDSAITSALEGMDKLPSAYRGSSPLAVWRGLNEDYAKGMARFDRVGIREMLVKEGEAGSIGNTALAEKIVGNSPQALDAYNDFKAFFGATSPEFQAMQGTARQRVLRGAIDNRTGYISGAELRSRLSDMRPEVAEELFGANQQELHRIGEALSKAQGKLDTEDLVRLGESNSLTARAVNGLLEAEKTRAVAYNNKLINAASQGALDADTIKPSEFVRYASQMDPDQAAKVMGILSDQPELVREVRQLGIEEIWGRAQAGEVGRERVSSKLLDAAMGTPTQQRTWRVILGNETVDGLNKFAEVASPREFAARAYKTAGAIGAGMEAPKLFLKGEVGALPEIASRFLLATLYSGPLKRSVSNLLTHNDRSRFLNSVIASEPFVKALGERFGGDGAMAVMNALREIVEPEQKRKLAVTGRVATDFDPRSLSEEDYRKWIENHLKQ